MLWLGMEVRVVADAVRAHRSLPGRLVLAIASTAAVASSALAEPADLLQSTVVPIQEETAFLIDRLEWALDLVDLGHRSHVHASLIAAGETAAVAWASRLKVSVALLERSLTAAKARDYKALDAVRRDFRVLERVDDLHGEDGMWALEVELRLRPWHPRDDVPMVVEKCFPHPQFAETPFDHARVVQSRNPDDWFGLQSPPWHEAAGLPWPFQGAP